MVPPEVQETLLLDPVLGFVPPALVARWRNMSTSAHAPQPDAAWYAAVRQADEMRSICVRALRDAGAPLLLGTDTANPFVVPGLSVHEELSLLVGAGLTPYEALRAGTAEAAAFLGTPEESGTIAPGKRADLLLVTGNPLEDVGNAARQVGVAVGGVWMAHDTLMAELREVPRRCRWGTRSSTSHRKTIRRTRRGSTAVHASASDPVPDRMTRFQALVAAGERSAQQTCS